MTWKGRNAVQKLKAPASIPYGQVSSWPKRNCSGSFSPGGISMSEVSWDSVVAERNCVAAAEVLKSKRLIVCARRADPRTDFARFPVQTTERNLAR